MRFDVTIITSQLTAARRQHCETLVEEMKKEHEVEWRFMADHDPESVDRAFIESSVKLEALADPRLERFNKYIKTLHLRNVSNAKKHQAALQHVADAGDARPDTVFMVLEDDVLAGAEWSEKLKTTVTTIPEDAGWVSLGVPTRGSAAFQELGDPYEVLPCCESYIVKPSAARVLASAFFPVRYVTNVHLTYLLKSLKQRAYLCQPHVFLDGTKYGAFISVLNAGNQLILNSTYMGARRQLVDEGASDDEKLRDIQESLRASTFGTHPDFMHLKALAMWRRSGAHAAAEVFGLALDTYDANNALINAESQFLRDYIALHRDLQTGV